MDTDTFDPTLNPPPHEEIKLNVENGEIVNPPETIAKTVQFCIAIEEYEQTKCYNNIQKKIYNNCNVCGNLSIQHANLIYATNAFLKKKNNFTKIQYFPETANSYMGALKSSYKKHSALKEEYRLACLSTFFENTFVYRIDKVLSRGYTMPLVTTAYKINRTLMTFFFPAVEKITDAICCYKGGFRNPTKMKLFPFQIAFKNGRCPAPVSYKVVRTLDVANFDDEDFKEKINLLRKYDIYNDGRMSIVFPMNIFIIENENGLPFQDYSINPYRELLKGVDIDFDADNYVVLWSIEILECPLKNTTAITDKIINMVNERKGGADEIDQQLDILFNPPPKPKKKRNKKKKSAAEPEPEPEPEEEQVELSSEEETEETEEEINYIERFKFIYNRHYEFTTETDIIECALHDLLKSNFKFVKLFEEYDTIRVIKPIEKNYKTNGKYFNIILFNSTTKQISSQFHIYLSPENKVVNVTRIQSLF